SPPSQLESSKSGSISSVVPVGTHAYSQPQSPVSGLLSMSWKPSGHPTPQPPPPPSPPPPVPDWVLVEVTGPSPPCPPSPEPVEPTALEVCGPAVVDETVGPEPEESSPPLPLAPLAPPPPPLPTDVAPVGVLPSAQPIDDDATA